MIQFNGVSKAYGQVTALDSVSFDVQPGEVFGYIGPNGAGKTTTMKILTGLVQSYEGVVTVNGDVGYVPQDAGFQEWRTVEHALQTFSALSGIRGTAQRRRIESVLETVGISEHLKRKISHLSGGTVQKLRIAQALLHDPEVLVLDEPLSGLDPSARVDVRRIVRELRDGGKTVLLSSHILNDIEGIADRIGIINSGQMKKTGTPAELRSEFDIGLAVDLETAPAAEAEKLLSGTAEIQHIEISNGDRLRIVFRTDTDVDSAVNDILRRVLDAGLPVRSLTRVQSSLEDVYLAYTEGNSREN